MKKVLAALLASYALTSGQAPPQVPPPPPGPPLTTAAATNPAATAPAATAAATNPASTAGQSAPSTTTTAAPGTTTTAAATTTAAPGTTTTAAPPAAPPAITTTAAATTTAAPAPTIYTNPYCPVGSGVGRPFGPGSQDQACITNVGWASVASDYQGRLRCDVFSCCMCSQINCGFQGYPCEQIQFGDSGAVGVQSINVQGGMESIYSSQNGAKIECTGLESCKKSNIRGNYIERMECSGDFGCEGANIRIENPAPMMDVQCNGLMTCLESNIEIIIGEEPPAGYVCSPSHVPAVIELGNIEFNGQQSAQGASVTVINRGCDEVVIPNIECMNPTACGGITFVLEGNIRVIECDLRGVQNLNALPDPLKTCVLGINQALPIQPGVNPFAPQNTLPPPPQTPVTTQPAVVPPPAAPVTTATALPPPPPPAAPVTTATALPPPPPPAAPVTTAAVLPPPPPPAAPVSTLPAAPATTFNVPVIPLAPMTTANPYQLPPGFAQQLNCNPAQLCYGRTIEISPRNNFVLDCNQMNGCSGMTLTLNVGFDPITYAPVEQIDALKFIALNSGVGATININNVQGQYGMPITVGDVRCEEIGSCNGLTINVGPGIDVSSLVVDCQKPNSCVACTVNAGGLSRPCDVTQNMWAAPMNPAMPAQPANPQQPVFGWV